jgi:prophage antirepressor-like protein
MAKDARRIIQEAVADGGGDLDLTREQTLVGTIPMPDGGSAVVQLVISEIDMIAMIVRSHERENKEIPQWLQDIIVDRCLREGRPIPDACKHSKSSQDQQ